MFVADASGDHMVEAYSSMGQVMALYLASIVSFCFLYVVDVSALSIYMVLHAFVVCELGVESYSKYHWVDVHGKCGLFVVQVLCCMLLGSSA